MDGAVNRIAAYTVPLCNSSLFQIGFRLLLVWSKKLSQPQLSDDHSSQRSVFVFSLAVRLLKTHILSLKREFVLSLRNTASGVMARKSSKVRCVWIRGQAGKSAAIVALRSNREHLIRVC